MLNKGLTPKRDWSVVDWSLSSFELADLFETQVSYISRQRAKFAPETLGQNVGKKRIKVDWFMVDWTLKNKDIAEKIGCNPSLVSQKRKLFKPETLRNSSQHFIRNNKGGNY